MSKTTNWKCFCLCCGPKINFNWSDEKKNTAIQENPNIWSKKCTRFDNNVFVLIHCTAPTWNAIVYIVFAVAMWVCALWLHYCAKEVKIIWKTEHKLKQKKGPHKHNDIHYKIIIQRKPHWTFFIDIALYLLAWIAKVKRNRDRESKRKNKKSRNIF